MTRQDNIRVFEDTMEKCRSNARLQKAIRDSIQRQKMYPAEAQALAPEAACSRGGRVVVSKKRSFEAAAAYAGKKVCVLNFASASNPGGGVTHGSFAQEESLCRCSTLYPCLRQDAMWEQFYLPHRMQPNPLHTDDCIYTPGVVVLKTDEMPPQDLPEEDWLEVSVISCAAPNLRSMPSNIMNPGDGTEPVVVTDAQLEEIHTRRLRRILEIAQHEGDEVVILGAFGCGAFMNDPVVVARAMNRVVQEYRNCFDTVEFAVYCWQDETNFKIFQSEMIE